jgi:large subunit ribosomal protein L6
MPLALPQGVDVAITADEVTVKGANGTLKRKLNQLVAVKKEGNVVSVAATAKTAEADAMSGSWPTWSAA